jgi:hypothetical protein
MAASVSMKGSTLDLGRVQPLFSGVLAGPRGFEYDVSLDGQSFLSLVPAEEFVSEQVTLVQNWVSGLKK